MLLSTLRDMVLQRAKRGGVDNGPATVDYAIKRVLYELDLEAYFSLVYTDLATMTVNNPEVDVSGLLPDVSGAVTTGVRPERVERAELAFNERGTWSGAAVSYAVNDLVQGDGNPDSYYYECTAANTSAASNEPGTEGGNDYWARRLWTHGDVIEIINRDELAHALGDRPIFRGLYPQFWPFPDAGPLSPGKPTQGAFLTQDTFLVYPPPDVAYKLRFLLRYPVTEWVTTTGSSVTIEVPDNILLPAIDGMAYYLDADNPHARFWYETFQIHKRKVKGLVGVDVGLPMLDQAAYTDHTNYLLDRSGAYGWYGPINP